MRVLLVDDDPDFRALVASAAPPSIEVVAVASSEAVVSTLGGPSKSGFDFAVLDIHLEPFLVAQPSQEGPALAHWLRLHQRGLPFLLVSSIDEANGRLMADKASALGFLRKPIDLARFFRFLESYAQLFQHEKKRPGVEPAR